MENKVLARVNGKDITQNDVNVAIGRFPKENQQYFSSEQGKVQFLEQLISFELVHRYAQNEELENTDEFKSQLEILRKDLLIQAGVKKILDLVKVEDEELKEFFDANQEMFKGESNVRASHILVESEEKAKEIKVKINNGLSFEEAASEFSSCPSSSQGGDLGSFTRGKMVPEFENVAFDLEVGEVSEPVQTQFGYHLIKVIEKSPEVIKTFDEVKDSLRLNLLGQKQNMEYIKFINHLKEEQSVEIF